jgi:regulator of sigma E protease
MVLVNILVFIISLSLVIMIHELGHFVMAKRAGILCHEFSIGMGPILWKKRIGETLYSVRLFPIGGFVMMAGEEVNDEFVKVGTQVRLEFEGNKVTRIVLDHKDEDYENLEKITVEKVDLKGENMSPLYINEYTVERDAFMVIKGRDLQIAPHERGFEGKTRWQRFLAIFAGPFMNIVLATIVFFLVNLLVGFPNVDEPIIGSVGTGYPADGYLEPGDEIVSIDGVMLETWDDLGVYLDDHPEDRYLDLVVQRDEQTLNIRITPIIYLYSVGLHSDPDVTEDLIIGDVVPDTKADKAGFEAGDQIYSIDGHIMYIWEDVVWEMRTIGSRPYVKDEVIIFEVIRDGETIELSVEEPFRTAFLESQGISVVDTRVGINPEFNFSFFQSIPASFSDVYRSGGIIFTTLGLLFDNDGAGAGIGVDNLAGPLGIYEITSAALSNGFISLLNWIGLLSVNLAVINLLPIPALDGGRLVFLGYEAVSNRKPNKKVENTLHYVMYLALMGLFVFITFNDLLRILNFK